MLRPEQLTHWGQAFARHGLTADLQRFDAGLLTLRSGCLAFANLGGQGCLGEIMPRIDVPNGSYPVDVSLYRWRGSADPIYDGADVTAVRVTISDAQVAQWELLSDHGDRVRFMVDFGMASILDLDDAPTAHDLATDEGVDILQPLYEYLDTPWFMWHQNVLAFRCGRGDAAYDIWVGKDAQGSVAAVVLDLELLPTPPENPQAAIT